MEENDKTWLKRARVRSKRGGKASTTQASLLFNEDIFEADPVPEKESTSSIKSIEHLYEKSNRKQATKEKDLLQIIHEKAKRRTDFLKKFLVEDS